MIFEHHDYRSYLSHLLIERIQKNPGYSLRAFAKQTGVSASMLSEVLSGAKKLSPGKALEMSGRLSHSDAEEAYFVALVQLESASRVSEREKLIAKIETIHPRHGVRDLSIDYFHSVANWICVCGLTLIEASKSGLTADRIAKSLGITSFEAAEAMERWVRLELVEKKKDGRYLRTSAEHLSMRSQNPNEALRVFHEAMLKKAIQSLSTQTNSEKFVGSETIAFDPADLPEVSRLIEDCVTKILKKSQSKPTNKSVYHLGFQFFRVDQAPRSPTQSEKKS